MEKGKTLLLDLPVETVVGLQGQVYLDENRNGQRDEGEAPVPYARVRLQGPEARTALADGGVASWWAASCRDGTP